MPHLLSNDPMVVMKADSVSTVTLFDRADQKFIEVPHGLLEPIPILKQLGKEYSPSQAVMKHLI